IGETEMSSAWSQLEQLLTCAICLDRFKNPKMLPCQHTFCGEPCMEGLVDYARRQIKCPECRAEHRIPYQGIQTFPTNVTLMRFLELHQSITGEEPEPVPSMMERCGICTEKSMVEKCFHCDKKVCAECKEAHLDLLRREISRINSQVRRALTKLQETLSQTDRNSERLTKNQIQIREEIEETVRRFIKDLKDKESKLLQELDQYSSTELSNLTKMKEDLEIEVENLTGNCDLIEKHVVDQSDAWTDVELVEYKDIFTKTLEFLRNFDTDSGDYSKKIKFTPNTDLDMLRRNVVNFGELKFLQPDTEQFTSPSIHQSATSLSVPQHNALMRSQSDHRLAAQFARREARLSEFGAQNRLGSGGYSDTERDRGDRATSPISYTRNRRDSDLRFSRYGVSDRREYGEDRDRSRFGRDSDSYRSWSRTGDEESYSGPHFRSRFMRERGSELGIEDHDSDHLSSHRSVRFEEPPPPAPKVFDIQGATRGPLSGVVKLSESAHFLERLHENEAKQKVENTRREQETRSSPPVMPVTTPTPAPRRVPSRQVSEDEIEKQKKANKAEAAQATSAATNTPTQATQNSVPSSPMSKTPSLSSSMSTESQSSRYLPRRVATLREEEDRSTNVRRVSDASSASFRQDSDTSTLDETVNDEDEVAARMARRKKNSIEESKDVSARLQASTRQVAMNDLLLSEEAKMQSFSQSTRQQSSPNERSPTTTSTSTTNTLLSRKPSLEIDNESSFSRTREQSPNNPSGYDYPSNKTHSSLVNRGSSADKDLPKTSLLSRENSRSVDYRGQDRPNYFRYRSSNRLSRSTTVSALGPISTVRPSMAKNLSLGERESIERRFSPGADQDSRQEPRQEPKQTSFYNRMKRNSVVEESENKADGEEGDENSESEFESEECEASELSRSETEEDSNAVRTARTTGSFSSNRFKNVHNSTQNTSKRKKVTELPSALTDLLTRSAKVRRDSTENSSRRHSVDVVSRRKPLDEAKSYFTPSRCKSSSKDLRGADRTSLPNEKTKYRSSVGEERLKGSGQVSSSCFPSRNRTKSAYATNRTNIRDDCHGDTKRSFARRDFTRPTSMATHSSLFPNVKRSKSSHLIGGNYVSDDEEESSNVSSHRSRQSVESSYPRSSRYQYRTREPRELRDLSPPNEEPASGSSTWSQYLRNKYANSKNSSGSTGSANKSLLTKSKSSHAVYSRASDSSDDEDHSTTYRRTSRGDLDDVGRRIGGSGYSFALPRSMYMQKRRMVIKIGKRGTEPGCFTWPRGVAVGPENSIVVADSSNHRVQVFDTTGRFSFEFGSYGSAEGEFDCLAGVVVNRIGQFIVSDRYNHRIQVFDPSGRFLRAFGSEGRGDGKFNYPWGVTTDSLGFIYICDKENHRIQVFQSDGTFVGKFGSIGSRAGLLEHPHYIAVSNTNRVVVSDTNNHRIQIFDVNGRSLSTFGSEGSEEGQFKFPRGLAVDDQGYIIVGDSGNNRVQIFNPDGSFLKSFGSWGSGDGEFKGLEGVAVTTTGNILVCDRENHRIQ
ncbi:nhl repeat-containing protein-like protein, partial [Dinothrombium tinctorium]